MNEISTIIIDDERLARVNLRKLLEPFTHIIIVGEAGSCKEAIQSINLNQPELIFLDIQLMGETGFDLLDKINSGIQVIFVTAYDEYAIRAFEMNALDYLLKPVNPERLKKTIERISIPSTKNRFSNRKFNYNDAVYVNLNSNTSKFLRIRSIIYIKPVGNHTKLMTNEKINCVVLKTLKQWEDELPEENFIRIHRSTIVNIEYIIRIEKYSTACHRVYLKNVTEPFEISRRFLTQLKGNYKI
ncbi:MAG: response regulator transcription factor [Bacteroidales bacterium]|nr:response regulator transcription factor [Bacteroidales bacterium]